MKDNSVKKDVWFWGLSIFGFYLVLSTATWIDSKLGLTQLFTLVDIASTTVKVTTASLIAWVVMRFVFTNTLGKDFGKTFNDGWEKLNESEKVRWILITFLVIVFGVILM